MLSFIRKMKLSALKTNWDYSHRAHTYDQRADYSIDAVQDLHSRLVVMVTVADIGAGTGKLTKLLLLNGLTVKAVEPNDNMRVMGYAILMVNRLYGPKVRA